MSDRLSTMDVKRLLDATLATWGRLDNGETPLVIDGIRRGDMPRLAQLADRLYAVLKGHAPQDTITFETGAGETDLAVRVLEFSGYSVAGDPLIARLQGRAPQPRAPLFGSPDTYLDSIGAEFAGAQEGRTQFVMSPGHIGNLRFDPRSKAYTMYVYDGGGIISAASWKITFRVVDTAGETPRLVITATLSSYAPGYLLAPPRVTFSDAAVGSAIPGGSIEAIGQLELVQSGKNAIYSTATPLKRQGDHRGIDVYASVSIYFGQQLAGSASVYDVTYHGIPPQASAEGFVDRASNPGTVRPSGTNSAAEGQRDPTLPQRRWTRLPEDREGDARVDSAGREAEVVSPKEREPRDSHSGRRKPGAR